ncbi:MAG: hypothetical protein HOE62_01510 [Alphaproteobacteria bacterium]|nr:hypothetical protein [Alphaproteobacteria bacterium]
MTAQNQKHFFITAATTLVTSLFVGVFTTTSAIAAPTTITETCDFVLGDNDTKNEAREVSFVRCKRKLLERAGSFIQSNVQVTNGKLSKDQVTTYAAAVLSVEVVKERFFFKGESMVLEQTVKAKVDLADVKKRLAAIIGDKSVSRKVEGQQKQITDLEKRVEELRQELGSAKTSRAKSIRKEQNVVLERIDELSKVKIAIMQKIKNASNRAQQLVERGMTPDEVVKLAGAPRSKTKYAFYTGYSYGKFWVQFENGVVRCLILNFENKSCKSYEQRYRENLAK